MRMRERIGRTLHAISGDLPRASGRCDWDHLPDDARGRYDEAARKLIAAFRTPTAAMLAEGDRRGMPHDAANIWERMVFVALYEDDDAV